MAIAKKIVCFGDSNTWGACGFSGMRRDKDRRWTGIIDMDPGYEVVNCGQNGREIPDDGTGLRAFSAMTAREAPFDLLIVMLGTNDILNMSAPDSGRVAARMEKFLKASMADPAIGGDGEKILLISPPPVEIGRACGDYRYDEASSRLGQDYRALAQRLGVYFADAAGWNIKTGPDGVHFTEDGHRMFAKALEEELCLIL